MVDQEVGVAWLVLSPIALLTCAVAGVVIAHYRTYLHGTDLCFISLFVCLIADALFLVPIPAILAILEASWNQPLCYFYIWLSVTIRVSEILTILTMCVHWMTILRLPSGKQVYGSTKSVKITIAIVWCLGTVIGIMPLIGATEDGYQISGTCLTLPHDLGVSFALFFIVLSVSAVVVSIVCTADTVMLLRHMRRVAVVKYQAGRFYLPSSSSVAKHGPQTVHARYNELNFSSDLCRLVLAVVILAAAVNHLPFTVLELSQLLGTPDRGTVQTVVLWTLLAQSLLLPHSLWLISRRYRHALIYTWKVYFLRDSAAEEEAEAVHFRHTLWPDPTNRRRGIWRPNPSSCTLQSYTRNIRDVDGQTVRVTARGPGHRQIAVVSDSGHSNHVANGQVVRANGSAVPGASNYLTDYRNGYMAEVDTTDLDDGMTATMNTNSKHPLPMGQNGKPNSASSSNSVQSSFHASPAKSSLSTPTRSVDLKRSASSSSRLEWKEQMRKKHLPTIFVNEAFDADDVPVETKVASPKRIQPKEKRKTGSDVSLYYMSSDYHHDYLADNMPRIKHQESESEGTSNAYGDDDIDNILGVEQTPIADTSMSRDMDEAFDEVLHGVNSEFADTTFDQEVEMIDISLEAADDGGGYTDTDHDFNESNVDHVNIAEDVVDIGDIRIEPADDMNSPRSEKSVVLEPCVEERRPPWLDADDVFTESSTDPGGNHLGVNDMSNSDHDNFESEIDRGFEEALSYNYPSGYTPGLGLCFESIKEEPEETAAEAGRAEAEHSVVNVFKTQAVVSSRSSSRGSSSSERQLFEDSRSDCLPLNDPIAEEVGSEEELGEYEKNYQGPQTSFGRFYNNPTSSEGLTSFASNDGLTPFGTFGYSGDGPPSSPRYTNGDVQGHHLGNKEDLKPMEQIDHDDSFYAENDHIVQSDNGITYCNGNGIPNGDDQTYYFDGKDGAWPSANAPDVQSLKQGIQSLGPWPENEDDLDDIDMSFDSDFSEVSTSNEPSEIGKPRVNGFVNGSPGKLDSEAEHVEDRSGAFF